MYVKICGITGAGVAVDCLDEGADMIGVVYYPPSPRHVEIDQSRKILDAAENFRECGKKVVLVIVDELPNEIDPRFDYVQIHGAINKNLIDKIDCGIIRVVKTNLEMTYLLNSSRLQNPEAEHATEQLFILEMSKGILPGGNGAKWNWSEAKPFCERFKTLIAGGVTTDNITEVFDQTKPYGIDVSSGAELAPGIKDLSKVKKIIKIASTL
ncbi:MAG: phosphoribosylanthranilate isomerase [Planctomycetaceae bacterium]|nr:phosphoribosylanthranilate isomerase [Planctomycetaceae bacterium]